MRAAVRGQRADQLEQLGFGADVDAAARLVEEQHARVGLQPLGDDDLLLVAAGQRLHGPCAATGARMSSSSAPLLGRARARRRGRSRRGCPGTLRERDVRLDGELHRQPVALAVLGQVADAGVDRVARRADRSVSPSSSTVPVVDRIGAEHRAGELGPPRAHRGPRSRGSRRARTSNEQSLQHAAARHALTRRSTSPTSASCLGYRFSISRPTISLTISRSSMSVLLERLDHLAVAHDRDAVGDPRDLVEPVRDVEDGDPSRLELPDRRSNRPSISRSVSVAVGSSMITTLASMASALAISTRC